MSLCVPPVRRTFSDERGPGTFHSLGPLPKRHSDRKPPVFHIVHDDDEDGHTSSPDDNAAFAPATVPFPRTTSSNSPPSPSSPSSSPPPHTQLLRGVSAPILLPNGKPLKPSLKSSSSSPSMSTATSHMHLRARSEPSTPAATHKNVHFPEKDYGLATVRFFNCKARPASLSSPNNCNGDETETEGEDAPTARFPFPPVVNYEIDPHNSSPIPAKTSSEPHILLESLNLTTSSFSSTSPTAKPLLTGSILVRNLAFEKHVAIRFTIDDWQTVSEVSAHYVDSLLSLPSHVSPTLPPQSGRGWDRFTFNIRLEDYAQSLSTRIIWLVARYHIDSTYPESGSTEHGPGGEWWDNNGGSNYRVSFRPAASLRSRPRCETVSAPITSPRVPHSLSTCKEHALGLMTPPVSKEKPTNRRSVSLGAGKLNLCNYVPPTVHATSSVSFPSPETSIGLPPTETELATSLPSADEDTPSPASSTVSTPSDSPTIAPRVIIGGQPATHCDSSDREEDTERPSRPGHIADWEWSAPSKQKTGRLGFQQTDLARVSNALSSAKKTNTNSSLYDAFVTKWCFAQGPSPNHNGYGHGGILV